MNRKSRTISIFLSVLMLLQCFGIITFAKTQNTDVLPAKTESYSPEAYAISEITSKREQNVKHFRMSDGSFAAMSYSAPVHYNDGTEWKDIDNTLVLSEDENIPVYQNTANSIDFKFSKKSNSSKIIEIKHKDYKLEFSLNGNVNKSVLATPHNTLSNDEDITTLENITSSVVYNNIFDGVDIEYLLNGETLKENIIINKKCDSYEFSYTIKSKKLNLTLVDGAIHAKDGDTTVFVMAAPYMYDAKNNYSDSVEYKLQGSKGKYTLSVTANEKWINNAAFPVTIDPSVSTEAHNYDMASCTQTSVYHLPENVSHINNALRCSVTDPTGLYLKFNLPTLNYHTRNSEASNVSQSGFKIIDARVSLLAERFLYYGIASNENPFSVHKVTASWADDFSYQNRPSYSNTVEAYTDFIDYDDYCFITTDITDLVDGWYNGSYANNGLYIAPYPTGAPDIGYRVYTANSGPTLTIFYISSVGLEDYYTYTATDTDGMGTAYVNNLTGSLNYVFTDTVSANARNGMTVYHVYNDEYVKYHHPEIENLVTQYNTGVGFKLNIEQTISTDVDSLIYTDADGTQHHYFVDDYNDHLYTSNEGHDSKIIVDYSSNTVYTLEYKSGTKYIFQDNVLTDIIDKNNNTIKIIWSTDTPERYPLYVKEILADGVERTTTLEWTNGGAKLSKITGPDGSTANYTYTGDLLTKVTFDSYSNYTTNGSTQRQSLELGYVGNYLSSVKNTATQKQTFFTRNTGNNTINDFKSEQPSSYQPGVTEKSYTEHVKFTYYPRMTKTEDMLSDAYSMSYIFDKRGHTTYITDCLGNSKAYQYGDFYDNTNKITFESSTKSIAENYIKNGNFAVGLDYWDYTGSPSVSNNAVSFNSELSQEFSVSLLQYHAISVEANTTTSVKVSLRNDTDDLLTSFTISKTDGFEQHQIYYLLHPNYSYKLVIEAPDGTSQIRNIQIVPGKVAEEYNLLKNSSFTLADESWVCQESDWSTDIINGNCMLVGEALSGKMIYQTVPVSDKNFVFGARVKADTLKNEDVNSDGTETCVGITLRANYSDGTYDWKTVMCQDKTGGEYINLFGYVEFALMPQSVTIYLKNKYNAGVAYFDDVYLYQQIGGESYLYDENGNLIHSSHQNGSSSSASYNEYGDVTRTVDTYSNVTTYSYDSNRNVINVTTPEGIVTDTVYDSYGNALSSRTHKNNVSAASAQTIYTNYGTVVDSIADTFGTITKYSVNTNTLRTDAVYSDYVSSVDYSSKTEYNYYDNATSSDSGPLKDVAVKDKNGNVLSSVSYEYQNGKLENINRGNYSYNFEEVKSRHLDGSADTLSYVYLESPTSTTQLSYNEYDPQGNLVKATYGVDNHISYTYDDVGRVIKKTTPNDEFEYIYNSRGDLSCVLKNGGEYTYVYNYDSSGRVASTRVQDTSSQYSVKQKLRYDMLNRPVSALWKTGSYLTVKTDYTYTADGRLSSQKTYSDESSSQTLVPDILYQYNSIGMFVGTSAQTISNGADWLETETSVSYKTNSNGDLTSLVSQYNNNLSGGTYFYPDFDYEREYSYSYQYDDLGNITSITDSDGITTFYTYDALNQLKSATKTYFDEIYYVDEDGYDVYYDAEVREVESFNYDSYGNITSKSKQVFHNDSLFSSDNYQYNYDTDTWCDALSTVTKNGTVIRNYTGSLVTPSSNGVFEFEWDGRLLKSATKISDNTLIEYDHDADGKVIYKKVTNPDGSTVTTRMYYSGDTLIQQDITFPDDWGGYATVYAQYIYEQGGLAYVNIESDTGEYHYGLYKVLRNAQGDIVAITNPAGHSYEYEYSAYGELSGDSIFKFVPFAYRGYYYDSDLGMYNLGTRYYDPEIGRFINADSVVAGVGGDLKGYNLFAYCFNNPVNMSDPSGNWPKWIETAANWVNKNIIQPVANFFSTSTNTISGQFQEWIFRGSGSLTGGYSEFNWRLDDKIKSSGSQDGWVGGFGKASVGNANGKIGIGNDNLSASLKGVADGLVAIAQAGLHYKDGFGIGAKAKASVLSGRATTEFNIFGWQVELGVSGELLSIGAEATIGIFPTDDGGKKFDIAYGASPGLFGWGFVARVKVPG